MRMSNQPITLLVCNYPRACSILTRDKGINFIKDHSLIYYTDILLDYVEASRHSVLKLLYCPLIAELFLINENGQQAITITRIMF